MLKTIQLTLTQIKYGGGSIGDDIRIELEVIGKFLRVDRQIKPGATANIDYEIGKFETDQKFFRYEKTALAGLFLVSNILLRSE